MRTIKRKVVYRYVSVHPHDKKVEEVDSCACGAVLGHSSFAKAGECVVVANETTGIQHQVSVIVRTAIYTLPIEQCTVDERKAVLAAMDEYCARREAKNARRSKQKKG